MNFLHTLLALFGTITLSFTFTGNSSWADSLPGEDLQISIVSDQPKQLDADHYLLGALFKNNSTKRWWLEDYQIKIVRSNIKELKVADLEYSDIPMSRFENEAEIVKPYVVIFKKVEYIKDLVTSVDKLAEVSTDLASKSELRKTYAIPLKLLPPFEQIESMQVVLVNDGKIVSKTPRIPFALSPVAPTR